jgi:hypothetical protein
MEVPEGQNRNIVFDVLKKDCHCIVAAPTFGYHGRMLDPVGEFGDAAPYPVEDVPKDYPIQVDEGKSIVTVKAGITTRVLLDYLAVYT